MTTPTPTPNTDPLFFQIIPGQPPIPLLAWDPEGKPRVADGHQLFTLPQAAQVSGFSEGYLRQLWHGTWDAYLTPDDSTAAEPTSPGSSGGNGKGGSAVTPNNTVPPLRAHALRHMLFGHLDEEQFTAFIDLCRLRGLNPFGNQISAVLEYDRHLEKQIVQPLLRIEGIRLLAHRTGLYAGCDEPVFSYNEHGQLEKAAVTVHRLTHGNRHPYIGVAHFKEFAPPPEVDPIWDSKPHVCLQKCAEAAAIRKAFPQELGGIYTPEEWSRSQHISRLCSDENAQAMPRFVSYPMVPLEDSGDQPNSPRTFPEFVRRLQEFGFEEEESRVSLIARCRARWPGLANAHPQAFWKRILEEVANHQRASTAA